MEDTFLQMKYNTTSSLEESNRQKISESISKYFTKD